MGLGRRPGLASTVFADSQSALEPRGMAFGAETLLIRGDVGDVCVSLCSHSDSANAI